MNVKMKKLLQFLILILCSCSIDSEESGEKLSFRMLSVCGDSDEEDSFLDSTVFVKNPDGSADAARVSGRKSSCVK